MVSPISMDALVCSFAPINGHWQLLLPGGKTAAADRWRRDRWLWMIQLAHDGGVEVGAGPNPQIPDSRAPARPPARDGKSDRVSGDVLGLFAAMGGHPAIVGF